MPRTRTGRRIGEASREVNNRIWDLYGPPLIVPPSRYSRSGALDGEPKDPKKAVEKAARLFVKDREISVRTGKPVDLGVTPAEDGESIQIWAGTPDAYRRHYEEAVSFLQTLGWDSVNIAPKDSFLGTKFGIITFHTDQFQPQEAPMGDKNKNVPAPVAPAAEASPSFLSKVNPASALVGAGLGFFFGGPIGAAVGAGLGGYLVKKPAAVGGLDDDASGYLPDGPWDDSDNDDEDDYTDNWR